MNTSKLIGYLLVYTLLLNLTVHAALNGIPLFVISIMLALSGVCGWYIIVLITEEKKENEDA